MANYVALLRAVNVGGTGKLPMETLREMANSLGFDNVRTWIASGNLLFESSLSETEIKAAIEGKLEEYAGKHVPVFVRTAAEIAAVETANPFPDAQGSRHLIYFLDDEPPTDIIENMRDKAGERIALGRREIHIDYGDNIRSSKLKMPKTLVATARNMNTAGKLAKMLLVEGS